MVLPKLLIVEDEALIAEDIHELCTLRGYEVCAVAYNAGQALLDIAAYTPDLVLLDINISDDIDGIEIAQHLEHKYQIPYLFITSYTDDNTLKRVRDMKYLGYIVKPFTRQQLYTSLDLAWAKTTKKDVPNHTFENLAVELTTRESEILQLVLSGLTLTDVGRKLFLSANTIKYHLKNIYTKLDVHSRAELFAKFR